MKRRDFVIKGGLGALAAVTSTSVLANALNFNGANAVINVGIIGSGNRGTGLMPILNAMDGIHVTACCDVLPFRLEEGLAKAGRKAKGYNDYRKLLDNKDVDAVIIATPLNTHSQIGIDSIDAGKHVFAEKTLAKGYSGIKALVEKGSQSSLIFQTGHQYHSSRLYNHVVNLIREGKIGKVVAFDCQWNRNGDWRRPVPQPSMEKAINWRMYREYSGGLVAELCSHQIDFANWVLDATPNKVLGVGGVDYWKDGRETFDNIHLIYSYPDGVKAKFTCLTSNSKDDFKIKVLGDKGTIVLDYEKAWFYPEANDKKEMGNVDGVSGATKAWEQENGIPIEVEHANPTKQALMDFKDSILNNTAPNSNLITGANTAVGVQMGLDAMYNNEIIHKTLKDFY